MQAYFIIDKNGDMISPTTPINFDVTRQQGYSGFRDQITLEFFNNIITNGSIITPDFTSVVTSGMTGSLNILARGSQYSPFASIAASPIDISTLFNIYPQGVIQALQFEATNITGCNYIRVIYYTGG